MKDREKYLQTIVDRQLDAVCEARDFVWSVERFASSPVWVKRHADLIRRAIKKLDAAMNEGAKR